MNEKRTFTIVSIPEEPRKTQKDDKPYWVAVDDNDDNWLCWTKELADAVRERKGQAVEYDVYVKMDGDDVKSRTINGIPGVIEPQRKGGGKGFTPRDYRAEEQAKWPSFCLSYAKDLCIARGDFTTQAVTTDAEAMLSWLQSKQSKAESTAPVPAHGTTAEKSIAPAPQGQASAAAPQPSTPATNGNGAYDPEPPDLKAQLIPLRASIKKLDPQEAWVRHEELQTMSLQDLQQVKKEILATLE